MPNSMNAMRSRPSSWAALPAGILRSPKKSKNCFFAQVFLEARFVGGIVVNVRLNLQFHGTFIGPL